MLIEFLTKPGALQACILPLTFPSDGISSPFCVDYLQYNIDINVCEASVLLRVSSAVIRMNDLLRRE